jgi:hypothetical protein
MPRKRHKKLFGRMTFALEILDNWTQEIHSEKNLLNRISILLWDPTQRGFVNRSTINSTNTIIELFKRHAIQNN